MATESKPRPYWHVDLKWIFGILATFFLSISLLLFVLTTLTAEKTAIPLATLIVAGQNSRNGLDDEVEINDFKNKHLQSRENIFYPMERKDVSITRADLETLSPREIRLKIFRQVVEPFYYGQIDEETKKQAGLLAFLNIKTHELLQQIFFISIIPLVISLAGVIFFSYRYGRLVSPAVIFLLVSTLPAALLFTISNSRPGEGESGPIPFLPNEVAQEVAKTLATPYYVLYVAGIVLIVAIIILKTVKKLINKKTS